MIIQGHFFYKLMNLTTDKKLNVLVKWSLVMLHIWVQETKCSSQVVTTHAPHMGSKHIKIDYVSAQAMLQDFAQLSVKKGGMKPAYNVYWYCLQCVQK